MSESGIGCINTTEIGMVRILDLIIGDLEIFHRRLDVLVAEVLLNSSNIDTTVK
jgi:hypothetical protein